MTFAQPLAWFLLLSAIPIVLLYILKVRPRQEPVSATIFWQQVFEERRTQSFWRRWRHLLSLLSSLLFLSLLIASVLDPVPTRKKPEHCVIVIDNSASMNARPGPGQPTRLDQAKTEIRRFLDNSDAARHTAILTADGSPHLVVGFTNHLGTLRHAVASISGSDSPTALSESVKLAQQLVATAESSQVIVYTDGCTEELAELTKLPNVHFFPLGQPVDNLAITKFQARRSQGDAVGYEVLVELAHFGTEPVEARLELELDERIVDVIPLTLEPNIPQTRVIRNTTPQGGLLRATLRLADDTQGITDALATDNIALAFLPERAPQHVYLCGQENYFLQQVLQAQPNVEVHVLAAVPADMSEKVPDGAVLVLHRTIPPRLPKGNVFVVDPRGNPDGGCDLFDVGELLDMPDVAATAEESPLMKFVRLKNMTIFGARSIALRPSPADWVVLAETPESSPVYAFRETNDAAVAVLSANLSQGDLALRTAFPIMVSQALACFRGGGELEPAFSTGQTVTLPLKTASDTVILRSPSGQERAVPVQAGRVSLGPLSETGIWTLREATSEAETLAQIACNLSCAAESNLCLAPATFCQASTTTRPTSPQTTLQAGSRPIRFLLCFVALLYTCAEWLLYQRRWID